MIRYRRYQSARRAFTLVELMMVVLLMSILAVSVIPAMGSVQGMREGAARDDIARYLEIAKARAMATGMPSGVEISMSDSSLTLVRINDAGAIETLIDPLTASQRTLIVPSTYSGVTVSAMMNGDGVSGSGVVWFDYEAKPHTRSSGGAFSAINGGSVTIELSSGDFVLVHPYTGVVETP